MKIENIQFLLVVLGASHLAAFSWGWFNGAYDVLSVVYFEFAKYL